MQSGSEQKQRELCAVLQVPDSCAVHDASMHQALQALHERLQGVEGAENERRAAADEQRAWLAKTKVFRRFYSAFIFS